MVRSSRLLIGAALAAPWLFATFVLSQTPRKDTREIGGKVVPLAGLLEKFGVKLDKDAEAVSLALVGDDGQVYPLIKDTAARMFFTDKKMLNRPVRVTGRTLGDTRLLQVLSIRTVVNGKIHEPYYWCDVCKIKRFEMNACDCCGAPLEFREDPVGK